MIWKKKCSLIIYNQNFISSNEFTLTIIAIEVPGRISAAGHLVSFAFLYIAIDFPPGMSFPSINFSTSLDSSLSL